VTLIGRTKISVSTLRKPKREGFATTSKGLFKLMGSDNRGLKTRSHSSYCSAKVMLSVYKDIPFLRRPQLDTVHRGRDNSHRTDSLLHMLSCGNVVYPLYFRFIPTSAQCCPRLASPSVTCPVFLSELTSAPLRGWISSCRLSPHRPNTIVRLFPSCLPLPSVEGCACSS
jgi:hypothetical protein